LSGDLKFEILDDSRRGQWNGYLQKNDLAIAWQVYDWHDLLEKHHPHDFLPLAAIQNGEIRGVFPLYILKDKAFRNQFISVPFAVAGGIVADSPDVEHGLLEKAIGLAGQRRVFSLVLKQYKHKIDGDLRTDEAYHNRELSLGVGLDRLWTHIAPKNRAMITAVKENGLSLEYPSGNLGDFYAVLFSDSHRQGIPCVDKRWIEDLVRSDMYACALVRRKGRAIAGTLVKLFKKTVSFPFTSLKRPDRFHHQAAYWLYWELLTLFAQKGYEIFHSGRLPADESAPDFRLGWNGVPYPYYYQYYPNYPGRTESARRGLKRRLFSRFWRVLPKSVAAKLSPSLIRKFP
jgi:hypothetical protein